MSRGLGYGRGTAPNVPSDIWRWIEPEPNSGCWLWLGHTNDGYGWWRMADRRAPATHFVWEFERGPVPVDLVPDHLCRTPQCVNPGHLEWVTNQVNVLRGIGPAAVNAKKTHCMRGHEFTAENTRIYQQHHHHGLGRACRACGRLRSRV